MSRITYVNGRYVPHRQASVHVDDRGYQFADGIYEVFAVRRGHLVDEDAHLARLARSLAEIRMISPIGISALRVVLREICRRNAVTDAGVVYLQMTRGVAPRAHAFPRYCRGSIVVTARPLATTDDGDERGVAVITAPDLRWKRRDIKTVALLPNVLGKQAAVERGAYEAWLVEDDGTVTEGTASNAWIVLDDATVVTREADESILNGITRMAILDFAAAIGVSVVVRPFTVAEAMKAREAFLTGSTSFVKPVISIDGQAIGDGAPGPVTRRILHAYRNHAAGKPVP